MRLRLTGFDQRNAGVDVNPDRSKEQWAALTKLMLMKVKVAKVLLDAARSEWQKLEAIYGTASSEALGMRFAYAKELRTGDEFGMHQNPAEAFRLIATGTAAAIQSLGEEHELSRMYRSELESFQKAIDAAAKRKSPFAGKPIESMLIGVPKEQFGMMFVFVLMKGRISSGMVAQAQQVLGANDNLTVAAMDLFARQSLESRQIDEAEKLLRENLDLLEKAKTESRATAVTRALLGEVLMERRKAGDARKLLLDAWEKFPNEDGGFPTEHREARVMILDGLVRAMEESGMLTDAANWRKEYEKLPPERAVLPKPQQKPKVPPVKSGGQK